MSKKIVWDLFGGLNGSIRQAIGTDDYEIYTFDIQPMTKDGIPNIETDLATDSIDELIAKLSKFPKPDIITSSTMCNTFSTARRYKDGGTGGWIINEDGSLRERERESWEINHSKKRNDKWEGIEERARLGKNAVANSIAIIKHFKPKYWYIENPKTSLIWNYIEHNLNFKEGIKNVGRYGSYGFPAKKDTIFLSNINLNLKVGEFKTIGKGVDSLKRKNRSDIPKGILQDIFSKYA